MRGFFSKLKLVLTYGAEIEDLLRDRHKARAEKMRIQNQDRLRLCFRHRQEQKHSHFAEHNCDHCKALAKIEALEIKS